MCRALAWFAYPYKRPNVSADGIFDLVVVGGGINGTGIARDAAGRGLSVLLLEQGDLAGATSSASTVRSWRSARSTMPTVTSRSKLLA